MYICISGLLFLVYFYKRSSGYQSNVPSDYFFVFDIKNSINNLGNMIAWIINYPRGWQYGAPVRYPIQKIISGIYLTFVLISYYLSFIKNKLEFFSINFFLFSSMILFVFLNNVHLFYMDLPFLFLLQLVVISTEYLYSKNIKFAYIFVGLWFLINLSNQFIIKEQWLEYSFVANSNKSAVNYLNILKENEFEKYDLICISEQNRGGFGTEDGRLVNHLGLKNFKVISTKDKLLPIECNSNNSLNLVNDAWDYQLYSQD